MSFIRALCIYYSFMEMLWKDGHANSTLQRPFAYSPNTWCLVQYILPMLGSCLDSCMDG